LGIAGSGIGLGLIVVAPLATYLISNFGWRMAYIVVGAIAWIVVIPISKLLKKDPSDIGALPDGAKSGSMDVPAPKSKNEESDYPAGLSLSQVIRKRSFWLFSFIHLFFSSSIFLILTHLVPHTIDMGFSAEQAATLVILIGGATVAGRISWGAFSDRIGRRRAAILSLLLQAAALLWLVRANELWMLYLFALVYAFSYTGMGVIPAALMGDIFGLRQIGRIIGATDIGYGAGAAIGPAIGGLIFDVSNSYSMAFLIAVGATLVSALLMALVRREMGSAVSPSGELGKT
jgi:predicted MFS family arabinose efflux permease